MNALSAPKTAPIALKTLFVPALCLIAGACGPDEGRPDSFSGLDAGDDGITSLGDEGMDGDDEMADEGGLEESEPGEEGGAPLLDFGGDPDEEPEQEECASVSAAAQAIKLPADILFVVDNSGSMEFESNSVQANLNSFSQQIIASGVDAHVALISSYPGDGHGICVDAPLGGGACPNSDDNYPIFEHVDTFVNSHNALERVVERYGDWSPIMRPDAVKHVVVVSDDESNLSANNFDETFRGLDLAHEDYRLHAIVSLEDCQAAAEIGDTYIELANMTGGVLADLCDQNFAPVFEAISEEVIAGSQLACEYAIPEPPPGESFDPDQVNVQVVSEQGEETIGQVDGPSACGQVSQGWYYDDPENPENIVACPQTCATFQTYEFAEIIIELGCETVIAE